MSPNFQSRLVDVTQQDGFTRTEILVVILVIAFSGILVALIDGRWNA